MSGDEQAINSHDIAALVFAAFTGFFVTGWIFISLGAVQDLFSRWRGCFGARRGSYNVEGWEILAMENLMDAPDVPPLAPDVHRKIVGFESLTEACALVHRPRSFASKNKIFHRVCAMITTFMLPVNLIVFEYTARDFHCMSERPWGKRSSCDNSAPPDKEFDDIGVHIWGVFGLLLPAAILGCFWYMQDLREVGTEQSDQKFSHFESVIRLTKPQDQALLARSMDKWATRTLIAIAANCILIGLNIASDLYVLGGTGLAFFEVLFIQSVLLAQEFLVVSTLLTTALHIRVARKVTLLNVRRKFHMLHESKLFEWMRTRDDFRDFANGFLDKVMEPLARALAWIIWFAVFVLFLLVLNILLFCIFPFNTRWLLGGYESAFFLAIGIEGLFGFLAYANLESASNQLVSVKSTMTDLSASGIEPMLLLLEALGFQQIDTLRNAQRHFRDTHDTVLEHVRSGDGPNNKAMAPFRTLATLLSQGALDLPSHTDDGAVSAQWLTEAAGLGLPSTLVDNAATRGRLLNLSQGMLKLRELSSAMAATKMAKEDVEAFTDVTTSVVQEWVALVGIDDVGAVEIFGRVLVPQFLRQEVDHDALIKFAKERLQLSTSVLEAYIGILEAARTLDVGDGAAAAAADSGGGYAVGMPRRSGIDLD